MSPNLVAWRPAHSATAVSRPLRTNQPTWPALALFAAGLAALVLLWSFYDVVAGAVHRAETKHAVARAEAERLVVCSAFSTDSSRGRCAMTVSRHVPDNGMLRAAYHQPPWGARRNQLTASLD